MLPNRLRADRSAGGQWLGGIALCCILAGLGAAQDDPAGGRTWIVDGGSHEADDANPGTAEHPLRTIGAAAAQAAPGDEVLIKPGIYRERVAPARGGEPGRPIVYRADPPLGAIISGAEVWHPAWSRPDHDILIAKIPAELFAAGENPFARTISIAPDDESMPARPAAEPLPLVLGELASNGNPLEQEQTMAALRSTPGSWLVTAAGDAIAVHPPDGFDAIRGRLELTTRPYVFAPHRRGLGHIILNGLIMELAANQGPFPLRGMVSVRSGHDWTIEDCTVRYAATVGLDCGSEGWKFEALEADPGDRHVIIGGGHAIRGNHIYGNGLSGIAGWNFRRSLIAGNLVEGNNRQRFPHQSKWAEWGGIKLHATDSEISGNLVRDNYAYGIWLDDACHDADIRANLILRNLGAGIFCELNKAPASRIRDNVVAWSKPLPDRYYPGYGFYSHDSCDMVVSGNLLIDNAAEAIWAHVISDRTLDGKLVEASRITIAENLLLRNGGAIALPWPSPRVRGNHSDRNCGDGLFRILGLRSGPAPAEAWTEISALLRAHPGDGSTAIQGPFPRVSLGIWQQVMHLDDASAAVEIGGSVTEHEDGAFIRLDRPVPAGPHLLRQGSWAWPALGILQRERAARPSTAHPAPAPIAVPAPAGGR